MLAALVLLAAAPGRAVDVSYQWSRDGRWVARRDPASVAFVFRDGVRMGRPPRGVSADDWYRYDPDIVQASVVYGVDPVLVKSILWVESHFGRRAVSRAGALGIAQLMPSTARRLGVQNPFDPHEAIWGSAAYLRRTADSFVTQNMVVLVAAYNSGDPAVRAAVKRVRRSGDKRLLSLVPQNKETPGYVNKVLWEWDRIHRGRS